MQLLSCAEKTCGGYNTSMVNYRTAAMRVKACGGCNLRLQYICGKLCNCCYKGENLRWLQYTGAGNYATAVMRGKTCGGYNTSVVNYATAAKHGKACGGCNLRLQYICGKLCNCCHARENLQYKCRKLCNWCHARQKLWRLQAREYAADAKRGNTRKLPMQTYGLFQEWEARSCLDMFAQNCLDLGGCV